jgi:hypothetical protein
MYTVTRSVCETIAQNVAQPILLSKIIHLTVEKVATFVLFNKMSKPKVNNRSLVTLEMFAIITQSETVGIWPQTISLII